METCNSKLSTAFLDGVGMEHFLRKFVSFSLWLGYFHIIQFLEMIEICYNQFIDIDLTICKAWETEQSVRLKIVVIVFEYMRRIK